MTQNTQPEASFLGLGIAPRLLDVLTQLKYTTPTPIQQKSIPISVEGNDVVGIAQTGTGKTLAFAVPIIQRLSQTQGRALVILPTRELALQVEETIQRVGRAMGIRTAVVMGGASMYMQIQKLRQNPQVIIATPGRLLDHLQQRTVRLNDVKILVLDEADRMFDMGFAPAINKIMEVIPGPEERQTLLFSATMPPQIMQLASKYMKMPVRVEIVQQGTTSERVSQEIIFIHKEDKVKLLGKLLDENRGSILVFSRTKHGATKIARAIRDLNHSASEIHSDRSLSQRREALEGFKRGKYRVLVATDIAARGIDVKGIELVINFDLPDAAEDYVHRIGRTGRAGLEGRAVSFATPDQKGDVRGIERLIRMTLPITHVPDLSPIVKMDSAPPRGGHGGGHSTPGRRKFIPRGAGGSRPFAPRGGQGQRSERSERAGAGSGFGGGRSAAGGGFGGRSNAGGGGRFKRVIM